MYVHLQVDIADDCDEELGAALVANEGTLGAYIRAVFHHITLLVVYGNGSFEHGLELSHSQLVGGNHQDVADEVQVLGVCLHLGNVYVGGRKQLLLAAKCANLPKLVGVAAVSAFLGDFVPLMRTVGLDILGLGNATQVAVVGDFTVLGTGGKLGKLAYAPYVVGQLIDANDMSCITAGTEEGPRTLSRTGRFYVYTVGVIEAVSCSTVRIYSLCLTAYGASEYIVCIGVAGSIVVYAVIQIPCVIQSGNNFRFCFAA